MSASTFFITCKVSLFLAGRVSHFKDEKAKTMTSWVTWPGSHSKQWMNGRRSGVCSLFSLLGLKDLSEIFLPLVSGQTGSFMGEPVLTTVKRKTGRRNCLEHITKGGRIN